MTKRQISCKSQVENQGRRQSEEEREHRGMLKARKKELLSGKYGRPD